MRSPFPGMDPYLEQRWGDFHSRLITYMADALQPGLPSGLLARMEERVYVELLDAPGHRYRPDVHVLEKPGARARAGVPHAGSAVMEPPAALEGIEFQFASEVTERFIQIIDARSHGRVVTMIEVLSPSNKLPGRGREEYLKKQHDVLVGAVNLVELDLLHFGEETTLIRWAALGPHWRATFHACVYRASLSNRLRYFPISLRERLPAIPIPLRPGDADVLLHMQPLIEQAYERGRYDEDLDYAAPLSVPLPAEDDAWAAEILKSRRA